MAALSRTTTSKRYDLHILREEDEEERKREADFRVSLTGIDPAPGAPSPWRHHRALAQGARVQVQLRQDDLPEVLRMFDQIAESAAVVRERLT